MLLLSPIGNFVFLNAPSTRHWFHLLIIVTRHLWYFYIRNSKFNIQLHLHVLRNRLTRHATPRNSTVRLQFGYLLSSARFETSQATANQTQHGQTFDRSFIRQSLRPMPSIDRSIGVTKIRCATYNRLDANSKWNAAVLQQLWPKNLFRIRPPNPIYLLGLPEYHWSVRTKFIHLYRRRVHFCSRFLML